MGLQLDQNSCRILLDLSSGRRQVRVFSQQDRPFRIKAMNPVPQRLSIHPAGPRRLGSLGTFENQRQRQKTTSAERLQTSSLTSLADEAQSLNSHHEIEP